MNGSQVRQVFLEYFAGLDHRVVRSSSLVPENDPTLLYTNAGMNQFKNVFLGRERRDYRRAVTCQKCVRAGGKHNDLENVGRTARHHTFFEMLGNFSFGDYFKTDAIAYAWDLVTRVYGLEPDRLTPTVFRDDDEAVQAWKRVAGVAEGRILRFGEKDNFWAMGDTGPCGPCSEILYDLGASPAGHPDCDPTCECGRHLEIWNLVFMQFERDETGRVSPLPAPSIDTGMGLERLAAVLQGKLNNYDTDLFQPLIREMADLAGISPGDDPERDVSLRIVADHSRAGAFLITDGVIPSNEGRGYVLRKILRRGIRHGRLLGVEEPFLYRVAGAVADEMGPAYDELLASREFVARVIRTEEEKFSSTLAFGLRKLDELMPAATGLLPGQEVFKLYDTYGFPLDLLEEIAAERGWRLDLNGFGEELERQKQRARTSWKAEAQTSLPDAVRALAEQGPTRFCGYEATEHDGVVVQGLLQGDQPVEQLPAGAEGDVSLDITPFYAESGGQVGDQGFLRGEATTARVLDTRTPAEGVVLHRVSVLAGTLRPSMTLRAEVDARRRFATACHHTATHLLHAALRDVLGTHVKQAGSLVTPDRLRFDFSHFAPLSARELEIVEEQVNEQIWRNRAVQARETGMEEALAAGAMALFGEKYQDRVRLVSVEGFSRELCGGTHLRHTGEMGSFKIVSEGSIAAGVRRIEAITGPVAYQRFARDEQVLGAVCREARVEPEHLPEYVEGLLESVRAAGREVERLRLRLAGAVVDEIASAAVEVEGVWVASGVVREVDRNGLRNLADGLLKRFERAVVALGAEIEGKAALVVMVSPAVADRHPAGRLIAALAAQVGGGGGGRPNMAEAGGKNPARLPEAMRSLPGLVRGD